MSASVGLAIQCVGVVLVALLSMSMRGSIKSLSLKCWTRAISLSIALLSLFLGTPPQRSNFSGVNLTGCVPRSDVLASAYPASHVDPRSDELIRVTF
jgi:hypothetical protein